MAGVVVTVMASPVAPFLGFAEMTKVVLLVTLVMTAPLGITAEPPAPESLTASLEKKPVVVPVVSVMVVLFFVTVPVTAVVDACDRVVPGSFRPGHPKSRACAVPLDA